MAGTDPRAVLSPKERLALSRRALVRELNGGREPEPEPRTPQQERARRDAEAAFAQSDPDDAGAALDVTAALAVTFDAATPDALVDDNLDAATPDAILYAATLDADALDMPRSPLARVTSPPSAAERRDASCRACDASCQACDARCLLLC